MTLIIIHVTSCHRVTSLAQCPLTIFLSFSPHLSKKKAPDEVSSEHCYEAIQAKLEF